MDNAPEEFTLIRKDAPIELDTDKLGDFMKDKLNK